MANSIRYRDTQIQVGDMVSLTYIFREGEKERRQLFRGILLGIKGDSEENRMIMVRKISNAGIGVERIIPLKSPFLADIKLFKKSRHSKAKVYFVRGLSDQNVRRKLYRAKS